MGEVRAAQLQTENRLADDLAVGRALLWDSAATAIGIALELTN